MKRNGTVLIFLGSLLILAAAALTAYNLIESAQAQHFSENVLEQLEIVSITVPAKESLESGAQPDYVRFPDMEMPVVTVEDQTYLGTLQIPSLELELPVISDWDYAALKKAPCRYQGSAYSGDLILMAHNYDSHFGRLHKLRPGDDVYLKDTKGNLFSYEVGDLEEIPGTDVEAMPAGEWDLTLFTCTYGGQNRIAVRCFAADPK